MQWLEELNDEQQRAVMAEDGPLLIMAGPGTGKTKTLTARIAYLLASSRARPSQLLALTFTNKAASEMQARLKALIGTKQVPLVTTFHALCHQLLKNEGESINFVSEYERMLIVKQLRRTAKLKSFSARELALEISRLKNLPPAEPPGDESLKKLLGVYNQELAAHKLYDFDDLLLKTRLLLSQKEIRLPYTYILVDEFQDTNLLQYELLQLLRSNDNVCVIGDPLQAIYGFRGASGDMFERFRTDFPTATRVNLTRNYRSVSQVLGVTNAIFPDSPQLQAQIDLAGEVRAIEVLNEYSEASWVVNQIEAAIGGSDFLRRHQIGHDGEAVPRTFRDFAILYRTHHVGKAIKRALADSGIPFQVVGGGSLYEQPNVGVMIKVMRYLAMPGDEREKELDFLPALKDFSKPQRQVILNKLLTQRDDKITELAEKIAKSFGFDSKSLNQFISTLVRFNERTLEEFLQYIDDLMEAGFYEPSADVITLMTIHAAKGLEFTHVFLIAAEDGILPHARPSKVMNEEEEKRLFYVAVSRARQRLDILHAQKRAGRPVKISRFIQELDTSLLAHAKDETMAATRRRLEKRRMKRSQGTLFNL